MITAKLLILCALSGLVSAECGIGGTATVTGNPEKTPWEGSGCKTYTGNIVLATDNPSWGFVFFPELEEVTGSITAHENRNLTGLTLNELRRAEELSLKNPGATEDYLLALVVPHLEHLENLEWSQLHHESGLIWAINITEITNFVINDTRLYTLHDEEYPEYSSFRNLTTAATVRIERNHELPEIKLPALMTVTDSLTIRHNSLNRHIYFPRLEWAGSITIHKNGGFLNSRQNTSVDLPSITEVKSLFYISENSLLNNIFVPLLQNVGGDLVIENNTDLQNLSFPNLERVSGDVLIRGNNISRIELPALRSIDGSLTIQTFNCSQLEDIKPLVSGDFSCENATDSSSDPNTWATQTITVPSATSQPQTGTGSSICQTEYLGLIVIVAVPILVMKGSCFLSLFDLLNQ